MRIFLILLLALPSMATSAGDIIEHSLAAYGGEPAIRGIKSLIINTEVDGGLSRLEVFTLHQENARIEFRSERQVKTILNATVVNAWRSDAGKLKVQDGRFARTQRAIFVPARLFLDVHDGQAKAELAPGGKNGDQRILITYIDGEMFLLDVDKKTGMVESLQGMDYESEKPRVFHIVYDKWKRYPFGKLPTQMAIKIGGEVVARRVVSARANFRLAQNFFRTAENSARTTSKWREPRIRPSH